MRIPAIDLVSSAIGETHPITQALRWLAKAAEVTIASKGFAVTIVWRPDGLGDATTWAGVMTLVGLAALRSCPVTVWCPQISPSMAPIYDIPAGTYPFPKGSVIAGIPGDPERCAINCADGVLFQNLEGVVGGVELQCHNTTGPFIGFSADYAPFIPIFLFREGGSILGLGTAPLYTIPPFDVFSFGMFAGGFYQSPGGQVFVDMQPNTFMVSTFINTARLDVNAITGGALTNWIIQHTGCVPSFDTSVVFPGFLGTIQNVALEQDGGSGPGAREPSNVFGPVLKGTHFVNDTVGSERVFWGETDPTDWRKVVLQTFFAGVETLADRVAGTYPLPQGFYPQSFLGPGRAPTIVAAKQNLTTLSARIRAGNPPNAGLTVTIRVLVNGVPVPGSDITLAADDPSPVKGTSDFIFLVDVGDEVEIVVVVPTDLPNDIFDITATLI